MKYKVIAITKDGKEHELEERFATRAEADTFIGIEGTQMEAENVKEFKIEIDKRKDN